MWHEMYAFRAPLPRTRSAFPLRTSSAYPRLSSHLLEYVHVIKYQLCTRNTIHSNVFLKFFCALMKHYRNMLNRPYLPQLAQYSEAQNVTPTEIYSGFPEVYVIQKHPKYRRARNNGCFIAFANTHRSTEHSMRATKCYAPILSRDPTLDR